MLWLFSLTLIPSLPPPEKLQTLWLSYNNIIGTCRLIFFFLGRWIILFFLWNGFCDLRALQLTPFCIFQFLLKKKSNRIQLLVSSIDLFEGNYHHNGFQINFILFPLCILLILIFLLFFNIIFPPSVCGSFFFF